MGARSGAGYIELEGKGNQNYLTMMKISPFYLPADTTITNSTIIIKDRKRIHWGGKGGDMQ